MGNYVKPFRVFVDACVIDVIPAPEEGDYEGIWIYTWDGQVRSFDSLEEMTVLAPARDWALCAFGAFSLAVRNVDGRIEYRAEALIDGKLIRSRICESDEQALWELANSVEPASVPRACFFCRYSEVEKSTGWGHLCCNVSEKERYLKWAMGEDRRWPYLTYQWMDEWDVCPQWDVRPSGFGYRGGGHNKVTFP